MKRPLLLFLGAITLLCQGLQGEWVVRTLAGNGNPGQAGDFGKAQSAQVDNPLSVTRGPDQSIWLCEASSNRVRCIRPDGVIFTVVGNGRKNFSGDRGPALEASLNAPYEVKFDGQGDLFIADTGNHAIRKVDMKTRTIQTVAGTGLGRYSGDGDSATVAHLNHPSSLQFGPDGCLYICDTGNHAIRKVDLKTGVITTVAGTGMPGATPDGAPLQGTPLRSPRSIDFDSEGHLWMASSESHQVYKMDLAEGRIYVAAGTGVKGFSGNGGAGRAATLNGPKCLAVDPQNNVWIADTENHVIRRLASKTGKLELIAGTGERGDGPEGDPLLCKLARVHGIFAEPDGSILLADTESHRVRTIRNETKAPATGPVSAKGSVSRELATKLAEGENKVEAGSQSAAPQVQEVAKKETLPKAETAAKLEAALKAEDIAKREAIRALEEALAYKSRGVEQTEIELAKREQALTRKVQERKMQQMGLKQKEKLLREMESKEQAIASRERELGLRSSKEKALQIAALEQQMSQKKRELSQREKDLERKTQELRLVELERKEQALAARERDLKRRSDDLRLKELERQEQDLNAREQELLRKTQMLKLWALDQTESELTLREKALAERERALKIRHLERQEEELARREADVERKAREVALLELANEEAALLKRERDVARRLKELSELPPDSRSQPPLLAVPIGSETPVVYPLKPARDERPSRP